MRLMQEVMPLSRVLCVTLWRKPSNYIPRVEASNGLNRVEFSSDFIEKSTFMYLVSVINALIINICMKQIRFDLKYPNSV